MRLFQRRALPTCGHLRSWRKRSWRQANPARVLLRQPSSRLWTSQYRLNLPAHIFEFDHLSLHTMHIFLSKPQIVCLQSKWDVLDLYKSPKQHSLPWGGSLYAGSKGEEHRWRSLHNIRTKVKTHAPKHAERLQQYSIKYWVDLCNLQLTSFVYNILISPHIVKRGLESNRSMITRLVNRRISRCRIGRVGFLDDMTGGRRCIENRTRYHGRQWWDRCHQDSEVWPLKCVNL